MASDTERLIVSVEGRITDLEKKMARADAATSRTYNKMSQGAARAGRQIEKNLADSANRASNAMAAIGRGWAGIAAIGSSGAVAALRGAVRDLANTSAEAKRAGIGAEAFQELKYAAQGAMVGVDALTDGIKEMQLRADEFVVTGGGSAAEAFQRLGLGATDLKRQLQEPAELFETIIDRLSSLDKAAQIRIADEIFGGTGGEQFVRLLDEGAGYIRKQREEARATGNVLKGELLENAAQINREFERIASTIETRVQGSIVSVVQRLREFRSAVSDIGNADIFRRFNEFMGYTPENYGKAGITHVPSNDPTYDAFESRRAGALSGLPDTPAPASAPPAPVTGSVAANVSAIVQGYDELADAARQRIADLKIEVDAIGMSEAAAAAYRFEQELVNEAARQQIALTPGQRAAISGLAMEYGALTEQVSAAQAEQERLTQQWEGARSLAGNVIGGMAADFRAGASEAELLANALGRVADKLTEIGMDALLDGLFGKQGTTGGGLLGALFGGPPKFAGGGFIHGPGTGTSDSVLARVSKGEYVVRASQAARHAPLLEAINSGRAPRLPGFAAGGAVGGFRMPDISLPPAPRSAQALTIAPTYQIDARGSQMTEQQMRGILAQNNKSLALEIRKSMPGWMLDFRRRNVL